MAVAKVTGLPILEGINSADDMPYPISGAIMFRARINSFRELPKDKQPPRNLWNKPHQLDEFFDEVFKVKSDREKEFIDIDESEIE